MNSSRLKDLLPFIREALKEDIGRADITTRLIIPEDKKTEAVIVAKDDGIICGIEIAGLVFKAMDKNTRFRPYVADGDRIKKRKILARVYGPASKILTAERVALNFLSMLSGIATKTRCFVDRVKPYKVKILDTRKTLPGLRSLEKYAVRIGGGYNHRFKLDEMILIKDNHIAASCVMRRASRVKELIKVVKKKKPRNKKLEIEVKNLREFKEVLKENPDIIMLDNMKIDDIKKAVIIKRHTPYAIRHTLIEVSGNITLDNIRSYARCGIDFISIGSLTKDVNSLDISLDIL